MSYFEGRVIGIFSIVDIYFDLSDVFHLKKKMKMTVLENLGKDRSFKKMIIKLGTGETTEEGRGGWKFVLLKKTETEN